VLDLDPKLKRVSEANVAPSMDNLLGWKVGTEFGCRKKEGCKHNLVKAKPNCGLLFRTVLNPAGDGTVGF